MDGSRSSDDKVFQAAGPDVGFKGSLRDEGKRGKEMEGKGKEGRDGKHPRNKFLVTTSEALLLMIS